MTTTSELPDPFLLGTHFRAGGHENLDEDYPAMLDLADLKFFDRPTGRNFDYRRNPDYEPAYRWKSPSLITPRT